MCGGCRSETRAGARGGAARTRAADPGLGTARRGELGIGDGLC